MLTLSSALRQKISRLNPQEPYVWRLGLTEADLAQLRLALAPGFRTDSPDDCRAAVVYVAEWYHRCYDGTNRPDVDIPTADLAKIITVAGISARFIHSTAAGRPTQRYSLYVLGGLAMPFELQKKNPALLKRLCRLYIGADVELDSVDPGRAAAFRQSITLRQSLSAYFEHIAGNPAPADRQEAAFHLIVKSALDEALRSKYSLSHTAIISPDAEQISLGLTLRPRIEDPGEGNHNYIKQERLAIWGINAPFHNRFFTISLRFSLRDLALPDAQTAFRYANAGFGPDVGFLADRDSATIWQLPDPRPDHAQIEYSDEAGLVKELESLPLTDCIHLFADPDHPGRYTSETHNQWPGVVLYSPEWELTTQNVAVEQKRDRTGRPWSLAPVEAEITLRHRTTGRTLTYENLSGYNQIAIRPHTDILRYPEPGRVLYEPDDETEQLLPPVFSLCDILAIHTATDGQTGAGQIEKIEYLDTATGRYAEWTATARPPYGPVSLRATVSRAAHTYQMVVLHLPPLPERDLKGHTITYTDAQDQQTLIQDRIEPGDRPLTPTRRIEIETGDGALATLEVWRPFTVHEIVVADHVLLRRESDTPVLPYLMRGQATVNILSPEGYRQYDSRNLGSIYSLMDTRVANVRLSKWKDGTIYAATLLDSAAPARLSITLGLEETKADAPWLVWNYNTNTEPIPTEPDTPAAAYEVKFQSRAHTPLASAPARSGPFRPFGYKNNPEAVLHAFRIARDHRTYFFAFRPLTTIKDWRRELLEPLLNEEGGILTDESRQALLRFADETGINKDEINKTLNI